LPAPASPLHHRTQEIIIMVIKLSSLCIALVLALPAAVMANAPRASNGAVRANPPPNQSKQHHKVPCCSGRMQAQPHPKH
jgi:hypothetical protein